MTWLELFDIVFRDSGVFGTGEVPLAGDASDMKRRTNMLLAQWRRRRWLVPHLIDVSVVCDGSEFYTLGVGQTFDVPRTDQIDAAFARQVTQAQPNQPDFPLRIISSYEDYSRIALKKLQAGPAWSVFYDSGYPVAKVYSYPLMNDQYELHLIIKSVLDTVGDAASEINLPPEYEFALYANLIVLTRMAYRMKPDLVITGQAKASLQTLRAANFQVASLRTPAALQGVGGYSIFTDSWNNTNR